MAAKQLFAFGFGYVAGALAQRLNITGWQAAGTTRSPANAEALRKAGQSVTLWPGEEISAPDGACWLISVPPDDNGCPVFRAFSERAKSASWIGYLSTTGVYGDLGGAWVTEETPRNPQSREAKNRARAEDEWLSAGANIFRLPGIYGPGRSALDRMRAPDARRIIKPGQVFSRIHVADLAALLDLAIERGHRSEVFNVCDDEPAPADEVLVYAASLLGLPPPPAVAFEDAGLSPAAQRFYAECKRVSSAKAKAAFGWAPAFPTYREGLLQCLAAERDPSAVNLLAR